MTFLFLIALGCSPSGRTVSELGDHVGQRVTLRGEFVSDKAFPQPISASGSWFDPRVLVLDDGTGSVPVHYDVSMRQGPWPFEAGHSLWLTGEVVKGSELHVVATQVRVEAR